MCQRVSCAAVVAFIGVALGCGSSSRTKPAPDLSTDDGGIAGASNAGEGGRAGADNGAGAGAISGAGNGGSGGAPVDPSALEPSGPIPAASLSSCAPSPSIGAGIGRGVYEGDSTILDERASLNRRSLGNENTVAGLFTHATGYVTGGTNGFWDITDALEGELIAALGERVTAFRFADLDGDGDEDAIAESTWTATAGAYVHALTAYERTTTTLVQRGRIVLDQKVVPYHQLGALGDADGDGDPDVVSFEAGAPVLYRNAGDFIFEPTPAGDPQAGLEAHIPEAFLLHDDDDDGVLDLTVSLNNYPEEPNAITVYWWRGTRGGTFQPAESQAFATAASIDQLVDKTGDGVTDAVLLIYNEGTPVHYVARGTAPGTFDVTTLEPLAELDPPPPAFAFGGEIAGSAVRRAVGTAATLAVLFRASCPQPCGGTCARGCIFEACADCLTHADCGDARCDNGVCIATP